MDNINHKGINIFISSPGDVAREREISEEIILNIGKSVRDTLGYHLECNRWENHIPVVPPPLKTIQDVIMEDIDKCQIFILILYKRYGVIDPIYNKSHTEMEIEHALKLLKNGKSIMFLSYFKEIPPDPDRGEQEKAIIGLKKRLQKDEVWFREFSTPKDFRIKLTHDLYHTILKKFGSSTKKQQAWRKFWNLGIMEDQTCPKLAIICPPLAKKFFSDDSTNIWVERLMPFIPFEDFSTVESIERTLRDINFPEFKTYMTVQLPEELRDLNRVWLCLPRNLPGMLQLDKYKDVRSFQFATNSASKENYLKWFSKEKATWMDIKSPMKYYLKMQRDSIETPFWSPEHGQIIAKDFAVLARLTDTERPTDSGKLKDFFFAGIRGLGTWGTGWYLINKSETFQQYDEKEEKNIQLLLEVTFKNGEIYEVTDVSHQSQSYFENENNEDVIYENIRKYKSGEI